MENHDGGKLEKNKLKVLLNSMLNIEDTPCQKFSFFSLKPVYSEIKYICVEFE